MIIMVIKMKDEKNKNKNIIILIGVLAIAIITVIVALLITNNGKLTKDALKFKEEYESLNNTVREKDGEKYSSIEISKNNVMTYVNAKEALNVLKNKKAIIYVGAAWCPWCRNAVPVMLDVADDLKIDTIYYLNLDDEKSNYEIKDGKLVELNRGTDDYYKLLDAMKDHLRDYILTDEDGNKFDTKEKRIYMPYVITVDNGKITSEHNSTVKLNEGQTKYSPLTQEQYKELYDIYYKMFSSLFSSNACTSSEECN